MSPYHEEIYNHFEEIEEQKEKMRIRMSRSKIGKDMSTFASYTRQACNFVFPAINSEVGGQMRPRPGKFRIKVEDESLKFKDKLYEYWTKTTKEGNYTKYLQKMHSLAYIVLQSKNRLKYFTIHFVNIFCLCPTYNNNINQ
jgi:hypothetical protein